MQPTIKNSDSTAFPFVESGELGESVAEGLTKREYFAAKALQGLLARTDIENSRLIYLDDKNFFPNAVAITAICCADALLKELEKY